MFAITSTIWFVLSLLLLCGTSKQGGWPTLAAWFIIGWLPPIFYKLMAMKWGG